MIHNLEHLRLLARNGRAQVVGIDEPDLKDIAGQLYDELPFRRLSETRPEFVRRFVTEARGTPGVTIYGMQVQVVTTDR